MPNTREKLIELIDSVEYGNGSLIGNNFQKGFIERIADHLIANGVTVQEKKRFLLKENGDLIPLDQEWISVKDRLPEVENEVLILARHGKRNVITTGMYEDGRMNTEDSDWWWETEGFEYDEELDVHIIPEGWWEYKHYIDDDAHNYAIDGVVTHWMPLPEPPKGE